MPVDLKENTTPATTAILVCDSDEFHLGKYVPGPLQELARIAHERGIIPNMARLIVGGRKAGALVFYRMMERRPNDEGLISSSRMGAALKRSGTAPLVKGSPALQIIPELAPRDGDFTFTIMHGAMTSFHDSSLDSLCRNIGIRTIVPIGVSLNVAIIGATIEAVNRNYRVIVPTDCVAGFPAEYGDMILQHTLRGLAVLTTGDQLVEAWGFNWAATAAR